MLIGVTQLIHQLMPLYKSYTLKTLKALRHVSVLRPSSGSYIFLAEVTLLPDDGLRTETCRSSFSVLMCNFYISALVGVIIE